MPASDVAGLLARCAFPPAGTEVVCAVSGGADSAALLVLAVAAGCKAVAVHVDHGLRADSAREADLVADLASRLGAGFRAERIELDDGPNLEARARAARYRVLPTDVLTGHTADDRAETVLINLLRGAGVDGLAGMRPSARRPILGLRRSETRAVCAEAGITVVDDPSNQDRRFLRNRVRHELLPLLAQLSGRDPVPVLCRQADHLRDVSELLVDLADAVDPADARQLTAQPRPVATVAVREWLRAFEHDRHPPDSASVERVLAVARGERRATEVVGGVRVSRSGGRLRRDATGRTTTS
ncbi:MAG: tRNA(Ile)-lysidine synthase [Acidimicrobiia bacterium]|jgi:tRNA(Ile)-lysidine synthase|nr:tRNA(Ile)-lysidine synthase [Acidimicrobiia bacterium]